MTKNNTDAKLLQALLTDCRRSDRELAKVTGVSQPTITRKRTQLQETGIIQRYIAVPDFAKIGLRIIAVTFVSWKEKKLLYKDEMAKLKKNVLFMANGQGSETNFLCISVHRNFSNFVNFRRLLLSIGLSIQQSFLIDTTSEIIQPFNMELNAEDIEISGE